MNLKYLSIFALIALLSSTAVRNASAETLPAGFTNFKSDLASAGVWANVRKTDASIAAKSLKMVNDAFQASPAEIALTVAPNKYLQDSSDKDYCTKLSGTYNQAPLKFGPKQFATVDEFSDWFSQLSQGNGDDGKALYKKCDEDCSPSYSVTIKKAGSGYAANVVTSCNQPRDKDDDQYVLMSGIKAN